MSTHWDAPLTREIRFGTAEEIALATLRESADLLLVRFKTHRSQALEGAVRALMTAAETGAEADIAAATEQVSRFLGGQSTAP